jgi:hypothetical protein
MENRSPTFFETGEAGKRFDPPVSGARVRQLIAGGRLRAIWTAGGQALLTQSEIERFLKQRQQRRVTR